MYVCLWECSCEYRCLRRTEEGGLSGAGVTGGHELLKYWEVDTGPLQE